MALATQCPHCHTTFRVASDQLKLRGGIVRCGACQSIFDGNAHLIDLDALAASKAQAASAAQPESAPHEETAPAAADAPVYTLDFDHTFDPLGILPEEPPAALAPVDETVEETADEPVDETIAEPELPDAGEALQEALHEAPQEELQEAGAFDAEPAPVETVPAAAASAYAPQGRIEPSFDLPVDEELVARPLPGDEHAYQDDEPAFATAAADVSPTEAAAETADEVPPAALPLRASAAGSDTLAPPAAPASSPKSARAKAIEARTRRSKMTPTRIDAPKLRVPASADADEPEFVKRSRKQEASSRSRRLLMIAGAAVLALLLAAQLVLEFRNVLAARYPAARPLLTAGCALLGCRIGLPSQIDNLAIETGELSTLGVDTYSLNTLLRNQGSLVQAWPSIQLELTDANDKPVLRRIFGPADYLPQGVSAAAGFAARSEQPVRLNFALTDLKPSGYHMIVFYP
jgi:predicted Zn finger-like uncharacterized protein